MKKTALLIITSMLLMSCGLLFRTNYENQNVSADYSRKDVAKEVKAIVVDVLGVEESEVKRETSYFYDLGVDEIDMIDLIMAFEEEFDIFIPDMDLQDVLSTVGDTIKYINKKIRSGDVY